MNTETKCRKCGEEKGFFRTNGALWCNVCGCRKTPYEHATGPGTVMDERVVERRTK